MKKKKLLLVAITIVSVMSCTQGQQQKPTNVQKRKMVNLLICSEKGTQYEVVQEIPLDTIPYHKGQELVIAQPSKNVPDYWEIPKSDTEYIQYRKGKVDTIQSIYFE